MEYWTRTTKFDPRGAALADGHYSRRTVGSPQFMPPGETLVLITPDARALFGWWRPHPRSGLKALNGLDGWTCTIFRNVGPHRSSTLILDAELWLYSIDTAPCGPDGLITYVWDAKVATGAQSGRAAAGWCFRKAGYRPTGRSADGKKTLLQKPWP
jgi:hypothetical protein